MELKEALELIGTELKNNRALYASWKTNMALCFIAAEQERLEEEGKVGRYLNKMDKYVIGHKAADKFLKQLTKDAKE